VPHLGLSWGCPWMGGRVVPTVSGSRQRQTLSRASRHQDGLSEDWRPDRFGTRIIVDTGPWSSFPTLVGVEFSVVSRARNERTDHAFLRDPTLLPQRSFPTHHSSLITVTRSRAQAVLQNWTRRAKEHG
jgi:hypothetical protein